MTAGIVGKETLSNLSTLVVICFVITMWNNNNMDVETLLELVKLYPVLYDKKHKNYKDQVVNSNAWNAIAETLKEQREVCETTWRSLKEKFTRERKAYEKRFASGAPAHAVPAWEYFQSMEFLNEHIKRRKTVSNIQTRTLLTPDDIDTPSSNDFNEGTSANEDEEIYLTIVPDSLEETYEMQTPMKKSKLMGNNSAEGCTTSSKVSNAKKNMGIECSTSRSNTSRITATSDNASSSQDMVSEEIIKSLQFLREKESHEDDIFAKLVASELKKIPDGEQKKKLKTKLFLSVMTHEN